MERHRIQITEAMLIICLMLTAGVICFEYEFGGSISGEKKIDFQEAIALGVIFISCILYFLWRRIVEQEHEISRRVAGRWIR
jgi:uncharacterized membrane protein